MLSSLNRQWTQRQSHKQRKKESSTDSHSCSTPPSHAGFTLIEVMITIAIIAILASIALPSYSRYVERSIVRTAQSDLASLSLAIESNYQRTLSYAAITTLTEVNKKPTPVAGANFPSWSAASNDDYTFSIVRSGSNIQPLDTTLATQPGYVIQATPKTTGRIDSRCILSLDMSNARNVGNNCPITSSWL